MNTLFALVLLFQQESAETAFKKIEAGIERANNIRVLFTVTPASLSRLMLSFTSGTRR